MKTSLAWGEIVAFQRALRRAAGGPQCVTEVTEAEAQVLRIPEAPILVAQETRVAVAKVHRFHNIQQRITPEETRSARGCCPNGSAHKARSGSVGSKVRPMRAKGVEERDNNAKRSAPALCGYPASGFRKPQKKKTRRRRGNCARRVEEVLPRYRWICQSRRLRSAEQRTRSYQGATQSIKWKLSPSSASVNGHALGRRNVPQGRNALRTAAGSCAHSLRFRARRRRSM